MFEEKKLIGTNHFSCDPKIVFLSNSINNCLIKSKKSVHCQLRKYQIYKFLPRCCRQLADSKLGKTFSCPAFEYYWIWRVPVDGKIDVSLPFNHLFLLVSRKKLSLKTYKWLRKNRRTMSLWHILKISVCKKSEKRTKDFHEIKEAKTLLMCFL